MLLLLVGEALACTGPSTTADVQRNVETAIYSFVQLDDAGFADYRSRAIQSVNCLGEVIHPPHAASFLRLEGVAAFAAGNTPFAVTAFRSALSVEPMHQLQAALAPPGGPLDAVYTTARSGPPPYWTLPPGGGVRFVDGIQTDEVPSGLAVVQLVDLEGRVRWSGILTSPADLPPNFSMLVPPAVVSAPPPVPVPTPVPVVVPLAPAPVFMPEPRLPDPLDESRGSKGSAKVPVLIAAGAIALVAGGLYGGSIVQRTRYQAAPTAKRRASTNNLWIGGVSAAGVAVTVGVVGLALPTGKKSKKSTDVDEKGLY